MSAMTLLPCPFCGGRCEMVEGSATEAVWPHGTFHRVFCTACQARQLFHKTPEDAAAAWNHRAHLTQPALAVDVEGLIAEWRVLARVQGSKYGRDAYDHCANRLAALTEKANG